MTGDWIISPVLPERKGAEFHQVAPRKDSRYSLRTGQGGRGEARNLDGARNVGKRLEGPQFRE